MSLEALEQQAKKILEILNSTAGEDEKKHHILETTTTIRKLIQEELEELKIHGNR
ncbi:MAG TPA: hypothetical protein VJB87_05645 [Candidatus Nanoarchaeia archaeon]|nr:hypothetical protein [Candidatus Nanoarchaeia archaeon]